VALVVRGGLDLVKHTTKNPLLWGFVQPAASYAVIRHMDDTRMNRLAQVRLPGWLHAYFEQLAYIGDTTVSEVLREMLVERFNAEMGDEAEANRAIFARLAAVKVKRDRQRAYDRIERGEAPDFRDDEELDAWLGVDYEERDG
jgi:hypothetical protein